MEQGMRLMSSVTDEAIERILTISSTVEGAPVESLFPGLLDADSHLLPALVSSLSFI